MRKITDQEVKLLNDNRELYTKFRQGYSVQFPIEVKEAVLNVHQEVFGYNYTEGCGTCFSDALRNAFNLAHHVAMEEAITLNNEALINSVENPIEETKPETNATQRKLRKKANAK